MNSRSKVLTWGLPLVGLVTLVAGTGMVIKNRPISPEETPPRTPTTAPAAGSDASYIGAIGISEPAGEPIAIAAHVSGVVEAVEVNVGDSVLPGDPLFIVDRRRAEAAVAAEESRVDVARQELASLLADVPALRADQRSAEASLESASAMVAVAQAELADRANQLRIAESVSDPRAISSEIVDQRRFSVEQSEARLASARAGVSEAEAAVARASAALRRYTDSDTGAEGPVLVAARARIAQAERDLARAQADLDLLAVRSPIAGRVLQVNVRTGEFAPASVPSEGLIVLGRDGPSHLRIEIDEVDIHRFSRDALAWASPRGDAETRLPLEFVLLEPLAVPKTSLSGRTSELVDTRVMQVVYSLGGFEPRCLGQQFDVYIETDEDGSR